jgi:hypothetical protein
MSALPSKADIKESRRHVRYMPSTEVGGSQSMTSSAPKSSDGGIINSSALADDQFKLGRKRHRKVARFGSFEILLHIRGGAVEILGQVDPVSDNVTRIDMVAKAIDCWQTNMSLGPSKDKPDARHNDQRVDGYLKLPV